MVQLAQLGRGLVGRGLGQTVGNSVGFSLLRSAGEPRLPMAQRTADRDLARHARDVFLDGFRATSGSLRLETAPETVLPPGSAVDAFAWLRELAAVRSIAAGREARLRFKAWLSDRARAPARADHIDVVRERMLAIATASDLLLAEHDETRLSDAEHDALFDTVSRDLGHAARAWRQASTPVGRISSLAALNTLTLVADTADTASHEALLETRRAAAAQLVCEIERQFRADGGHVSRNPAMTLHALVELIPLLRTYSYLAVAEPDALNDWRQRMQMFLRTLRLCDRGLAAFHGGDTIRAQRLATVLKLDPTLEARSTLGESGYERIEAGTLQLICDVGSATHTDAQATSHASFGAFVLGDGPHPIFVNCGAPVASSVPDAHQAHRQTAHHTALSFPNLPNARLDACRLGETAGANHTVAESAETLSLDMSHRGYAEAFGLAHTRSIVVDRTGNRVSGTDQLRSAGALIRLKRDEPFAIHFHVADDVEVQLAPAANCVVLHLATGGAWHFAATGAQLYVETSPRFGRRAKPGRQAQQLVLRAATCGESTVSWTLSRRFA